MNRSVNTNSCIIFLFNKTRNIIIINTQGKITLLHFLLIDVWSPELWRF